MMICNEVTTKIAATTAVPFSAIDKLKQEIEQASPLFMIIFFLVLLLTLMITSPRIKP